MLLIKIGGGKKINWNAIGKDIQILLSQGEKIVIVHGANVIRDDIAKKLGIPTRVITSPSGIDSVYTDEQAIDVFLMAYAGLANKKIVSLLQKYDIPAIGLSGIDGKIWEAKRKPTTYAFSEGKTHLLTNNYTGRVEKVNATLIHLLCDNGYVPVICPPAISSEHDIVNTDNDVASAIMAGALGVKKMIVLFEAKGLMKNIMDEHSLIKYIDKSEIQLYMQYALGRMKKKLIGAQKAFDEQVETIFWGDARIEHPIQLAMKGEGTTLS